MRAQEWYDRRDDRQKRYAGRVLPHDRPILIRLDPAYAARYDGQVAAIVAANLISRMSPNVGFEIPDVHIVTPLPWAGKSLGAHLIENAKAVDPFGDFQLRSWQSDDLVISLGRSATQVTIHGSGWGAYTGPARSPILDCVAPNPIGPALAVIIGAGRLFGSKLSAFGCDYVCDSLLWRNELPAPESPGLPDIDLGQIWTIGTGSVGTAALYFLTLASRRFTAELFDMDVVKIENLDRSPIFVASDANPGQKIRKVIATEKYLRQVGVLDVRSHPYPLDSAQRWKNRPQGVPDVVISAANERNVRYVIEQSYPPVQIYGTTGANWNATLMRHLPDMDPCSNCIFPPDMSKSATSCATGTVVDAESSGEVDAALPFLSFTAGLMTAAEILKLGMRDYPFTANRVFFSASPNAELGFMPVGMAARQGCICSNRSPSIHRAMVERTRYAHLGLQ